MRLKIAKDEVPKHTSIVTAVGWVKTGKQYELFSCGDDQAVWKWHVDGTPNTKLSSLDVYVTTMACMPQNKGSDNTLALGCGDGTFRLMSETGREEKKVEAHKGAVISLKWSFDGTAIATAGEDGAVKIWSRSGMLRSTLTQMSQAVYSVVWSPDCEHLLFACGRKIHLKSTQAGQKQVEWKAHEGIVIQLDWSFVNNTILSGGEDCRYKIWDAYGRLLFCSAPLDHVVTAVAWSPNGKHFAVGCYNVVKLCDRTGWSYCRETQESGSIFSISWCNDGTQLACGCGNGSVLFGGLVDRKFSWHNTDVLLDEKNTITVHDILHETKEELDFRDRVTEMSLGYGALIVTTNNQCFVYQQTNWNTPHVEDLKEPPTLIVQCPHHFALVDANGIQVINYEGRCLSTIKFSGLRSEFLNHQTLSLCRDAVCLVDPTSPSARSALVVWVSRSAFARQLTRRCHPRLRHSPSVIGLPVRKRMLRPSSEPAASASDVYQAPACRNVPIPRLLCSPQQGENGAQNMNAPPHRMVPFPASVNGVPTTTLLVRNISHRLVQEQVTRQWPRETYNYDLLYLAYDLSKKRCAGHFFINFLTYESAAEFWMNWHDYPCFAVSSADANGVLRPLQIEAAQRQGFWPNVVYWQSTLRRNVRAALLPAVWVSGQRRDFWRCRPVAPVSADQFSHVGQARFISL